MWTDGVVERFKALCADGLSFSQIADTISQEFRIRVSRNACIGKARRLGIGKATDLRVSRSRKHLERPRQPRPKAERRAAPKVAKPPALKLVIGPTDAERAHCFDPLPEGCGVGLLDIGFGQCRWPHGEGAGLRFCGEATVEAGCVYCERHARLSMPSAAFQKVSDRMLASAMKKAAA